MQSQDVIDEKLERSKPASNLHDSTIPPAAIKTIIIGILVLIILIHFGFYKTYLMHFPKFDEYTAGKGGTEYTWVMHFHGMMMMGWMFMLLLQPILILKGKLEWHHRIGTLSYVLAPLALISLYLVNRKQYFDISAESGEGVAISFMAVSVPEAIFFAILYSLAIVYRHRPQLHMRFMASTAFMFFNPAVGRLLRTYFDLPGHYISSLIVISIAGIVTIVDTHRTKRLSPFAVALAFLSIHRLIFDMRETPFWQSMGKLIASIF